MGQFTSENQPKGRGKSEKTKFIEALKKGNRTEEEFYQLCVERAFDKEDNFAFKEVLNRLSPLKKSVAPCIEFDFPQDAKPHVQAAAVMKGIADGVIPPDIGAQFVSSIKSMIDIEEYTDLKERIEKLEATLNGES
tara:strand:+ start:713 stop:1120 length:408 start_codon:yes stop_codon:yes gene_type:complete